MREPTPGDYAVVLAAVRRQGCTCQPDIEIESIEPPVATVAHDRGCPLCPPDGIALTTLGGR